MAVAFYLDNRANKSGDNPIRVSISLAGKRFVTSVGFNINSKKWNTKTQRVINSSTNAKGETAALINSRLNEIETAFSKIEVEIEIGVRQANDVDIKQIFVEEFRPDSKSKADKTMTIFDYIDEFMKETGRDNNWAYAVYEKFNALKNHLQAFDSKLTFKKLDKNGLSDLADYFHNVQIGGKKDGDVDTRVFGMKNSTIKNQFVFLKWFLRWATDKGYNTVTDFENYTPKLTTIPNKVVFLNWDELMTVYNFKLPENKKYLDRVRDVFCFCCFTSLRYSDVANLKRTDIKSNHIEVVTIKTSDPLEIDLNDYSRSILDKYKDEVYPDNKALPVISNQRMNEYLKELGELCKIDEPQNITYFKGKQRFDEVYPKYALMSTHTGRRTFISNALMMGIPPQVVMKWTGHSDYKAMKPYIDIADKAKAEAMKMFNEK